MRPRLTLLLGLFAATLFAAAAGPDEAATVQIDRMPRPHGGTRGAAAVDARLAAMDRDFRAQAAACAASARGVHDESSFKVGARRLLETPTLYSVEIAKSWYCGGAYPDREATAVAFDLRTGERYVLSRAFRVGERHLNAAALPIVARFRDAMLRRMKNIADCGSLSAEDVAQALQSADLSLGVTRAYLIFYFSVPHVIAACFPPVQVPLTALAGFADQAELRRLGLREPPAR